MKAMDAHDAEAGDVKRPTVFAVAGLALLALTGINSCESGRRIRNIEMQNAEIQAAVIEIRQRKQ
jgi:hypothetical protein